MNKVICPVDFSDVSRVALQVAAKIAVDANVELIALHIANVPLKDLGGHSYEPFVLEDSMKSEEAMLKDWIKQLPLDQSILTYKVIIKNGFLLEELSELGDRSSLIVSGSSGSHDFVNKLMGSLTSDIFFKGVSPVLIIPKSFQHKSFQNICFATDLMAPPQGDVKGVLQLANSWAAHISFLSVMDNTKKIDIESVEQAFVHQYLKDAHNSNTSFHLNQASNPVQGIKHFMEKNKTDLLVLTHRDRSFWEGLFQKSTTGEFIWHTEVPLLLFHHVVEK